MAKRQDDNTVFSDVTGLASMADNKPVRLIIPKFNNGKLMITKISGGVRPNFQLMYSLGADVFVNAFNQRLSMWNIHGLYIPSVCDNGQDFKGEPAFVDLYRRFNIRTDGPPLDIAFNGIVLVGFFVEMKIMEYTQEGVDGFAWETPFLGRMNNFLEAPDPIEVADVAAAGGAEGKPVREGVLEQDLDPARIASQAKTLQNSRPPSIGPGYENMYEVDIAPSEDSVKYQYDEPIDITTGMDVDLNSQNIYEPYEEPEVSLRSGSGPFKAKYSPERRSEAESYTPVRNQRIPPLHWDDVEWGPDHVGWHTWQATLKNEGIDRQGNPL